MRRIALAHQPGRCWAPPNRPINAAGWISRLHSHPPKPMRSPGLTSQVTSRQHLARWDKALAYNFQTSHRKGTILGIFASIIPGRVFASARLADHSLHSDWNSLRRGCPLLGVKTSEHQLAALDGAGRLALVSYWLFFSWGPRRSGFPRPQHSLTSASLGSSLQPLVLLSGLLSKPTARPRSRLGLGSAIAWVVIERRARLLLDSRLLKRANPSPFGKGEVVFDGSLGILKEPA